MQTVGKFLGMVRVWRDDDTWKWAAFDATAPDGAKFGSLYQSGDAHVILVQHSDKHGEFIHGAVPA